MDLLFSYFLLLLCIMSPLLHADYLCPEGSYCPAGVDCSSNSSLCEVGVCEATTGEPCETDISIEFLSSSYDVSEGNGLAQPVLSLDGPLVCCSISVTVNVEDISAKGGQDYQIPNNQYIKVKFPAGETRASFDINIINDDFLEDPETFRITIFELSVPYGITLGSITSAIVTILDDDSTTLSFSQLVFNVNENEGPALPELTLSVPASFDFTVVVTSHNEDLHETCDNFQSGPFDVLFPNGTTSVKFPINISDDSLYEGDESFTLVIDDGLPDLVNLGTRYRATVVIKDDEKLITANFAKKVYRVYEHDVAIAPEIVLTEPSPCCFKIHAQLKNATALGRSVDFGYKTPKIYNYTFHAGSTCASPDANISITDDLISEKDETFEINIIDAALPFNVEPGLPATIIINDNDNAASFQYEEYSEREDAAFAILAVILDEPATSSRDIEVTSSSSDDTATGNADYKSGPYVVSFARGETRKYFRIPMINDNVYEGDEYFTVTIDNLPQGIVRAQPYTVKVKIVDDEYVVCFKKQEYSVNEGDTVAVTLTLSTPLQQSLTVQLGYENVSPSSTNSDYSRSPQSVRFNAGTTEVTITIRTYEDNVLEPVEELFNIIATYPFQPNNTNDCDVTTVTIMDDDDTKISCESRQYYIKENSKGKVRFVLSETPTFSFSVILIQEDNTTIGGLDYTIQDYRNDARFQRNGKKYFELDVNITDDDLVEDDEVYYIKIEPVTLPDRVVTGNPPSCKIIIVNDDVSVVTRQGNVIKFSKEIDFPVEVTATYYNSDDDKVLLLPGEKEIIFDSSKSIQRITLVPDCHLEHSDFRISASRTYVRYVSPC